VIAAVEAAGGPTPIQLPTGGEKEAATLALTNALRGIDG